MGVAWTFGECVCVCVSQQGTLEMIISGAICGVVFHLFAGQPLITIGAVGPVLVYEIVLYKFSK